MASITSERGKFRASVCVNYKRKAKIFDTEDEARRWADNERSSMAVMDARRSFGDKLLSMMPVRVLDALTKIRHSHADVVRNALPYEIESGIYFLILNDEVIYVGQSVNVLDRIGKHRREGRFFDSFNYLPCPKELMNELEESYILAFMPKMNSSFTPRRKVLHQTVTPTADLPS